VDIEAEAVQSLRAAAFPLYAVPPGAWDGDVYFSGSWGTTKHPLNIRLLYVGDAGAERCERGIEIICTGGEGIESRGPTDLDDEHSYSNEVVNFVHRFAGRLPDRRVPGAERHTGPGQVVRVPSAGPRHRLRPRKIVLDGGTELERVSFSHHPELRVYRALRPGVEILILGWGFGDQDLESFANQLVPVVEDGDAFADLERGEHAAWEKIRERKRRAR
jgi:hypothetical protein